MSRLSRKSLCGLFHDARHCFRLHTVVRVACGEIGDRVALDTLTPAPSLALDRSLTCVLAGSCDSAFADMLEDLPERVCRIAMPAPDRIHLIHSALRLPPGPPRLRAYRCHRPDDRPDADFYELARLTQDVLAGHVWHITAHADGRGVTFAPMWDPSHVSHSVAPYLLPSFH